MKITIVGGGTAGWLAAFIISKTQPKIHQITVVESSKIGIIGAGEGSTGLFIDLLNGRFFPSKYKVDIENFGKKTDATMKMGIRHTNWGKDKKSYFAPLDFSPTGFELDDYMFKYALSKFGKEKFHLGSKLGVQYETGNYQISAVHFDGHKVGKFFKELCETEDGVITIDAVVKDCILDERGFIKSISLDNEMSIQSDLFIDCTGFARVLSKAIGNKWVSHSKSLPMNTAMPFLLSYEKDEIVRPETEALALSSGWMWNIPLSTRRGCGYVFDQNFISKEKAQEEVEKVLNKKIQPIKFIEFDSGYDNYFWKNNVISLGLASNFVEPLEATSIHTTIFQLLIFINEFLFEHPSKTFNSKSEKIYNQRIEKFNNLTIDFISMHYQGGREDSEFWRHIKHNKIITDGAKNVIDLLQYKIPGYNVIDSMHGHFGAPLANWIFAGLDLITPEQAESEQRLPKEFLEKKYEEFYQSIVRV